MSREEIIKKADNGPIIIFATGNENKMTEIRHILADAGADIYSLKDIGLKAEAEETGETFAENSEIKAREIHEKIKADRALKDKNIIVMADDSGLCVDFLEGGPGVYSARWLGHDTPYEEKNRILLEKMKEVPDEKRGAAFKCDICSVLSDGSALHTEGEIRGIIARESAGANGFGYDPVFFLPEYGKTSSEISREEKNRISHRGKALSKMKEELFKLGRL